MEKCVCHKCMIICKESHFILLLKMSGIIFYVIYMFTITFNTILLLIKYLLYLLHLHLFSFSI